MAFEPTLDMVTILERIEEEFEARDEAIECFTKRLDAQDAEITKLKNEIAEMRRPKPVRIVRHDVDNERAELR